MHLDPSLPILVAILVIIVLIGLVLQLIRQPQVIGYLLARGGSRYPVQVVLSMLLVWPLGVWLESPLERVVLLGFVTSLSSTAVIIKMLRDSGEMSTREGQDLLGILLVQDLVVIPDADCYRPDG